MSGGNSGNFLNPKNLIPAIATGGLSYVIPALKRNMTPDLPPNPGAPPTITPPPTPTDRNPELTAQQRAKKLANAFKFGMASTITKDSIFGNAQTATPGLKAHLGQ